jgi:hypothetical protein
MSMRSALAVLGVIFGVMAGCQQQPVRTYDTQKLRRERFTVSAPALVLHSPANVAQRLEAGELTEVPWWSSRNDSRLNVQGGEPRGEVVDYAIYVDNRQQSFGDRHHDIHRRSAQSAIYGRLVR